MSNSRNTGNDSPSLRESYHFFEVTTTGNVGSPSTLNMNDLRRVPPFVEMDSASDFGVAVEAPGITLSFSEIHEESEDLVHVPVVEMPTVIIEPPPEDTYPSEQAAIEALHDWTKTHRFNVTKRRAFYTGAVVKEVWKRGFDCDRTGKPKCTQHLTDAERQRPMRGSMRIGCPMKIIVKAVSEDDPTGPWMIVHTRNGSRLHNHPPSQDARVHPDHR
jgi:hypothetical protein